MAIALQVKGSGASSWKFGVGGATAPNGISELTEHTLEKEFTTQVEYVKGSDGSLGDIALAGEVHREIHTGYSDLSTVPTLASDSNGGFITKISGRSSNEDIARLTVESMKLATSN
jgi:hypothetical protein